MKIFVSATDTDVGKTFVTCGIALVMQSLGYKTGVYKPIQSGAICKNNFLIAPDIAFIKKFDPFIDTFCSYALKTPCTPDLAAHIDKVNIDTKKIMQDYINFSNKCDVTICEGAGGLMVPIARKFLVANLIKFLNLPVVFVIRPNLGTINHTLLTLNCAYSFGLNVRGIIINKMPYDPSIILKSVPKYIKEYSDVNILGIIEDFSYKSVNPSNIIDSFIKNIDFQSLFNTKIPKLNMLFNLNT